MTQKARILLCGKNGQLGWEFTRTLAPLGDLVALDWPQIDFSRPEELRTQVLELRPQLIVNASAYTNVDQAETEPVLNDLINHHAVAALAQAAAQLHAGLVHISTDYVFDGLKGSPYVEDDPTNPLGRYAASKRDGELAVQAHTGTYWTLRTAWLYSLRQNDFVARVLSWSRQQEILRVVDDQVGSPTWARMLAQVIGLALATGKDDFYAYMTQTAGVYHLAGDGHASRLAWVQKILELDPQREQQVTRQVLAAKTADFPTPAQRPLFTALNCERFRRTFDLTMPTWDTALTLAMQP